MKLKGMLFTVLAVIFVGITGCQNDQVSLVSADHFALGTINKIEIESPRAESLLKGSFAILDAVEAKMSRNIKDSEVSRINDMSGTSPVKVSAETYFVIKKGLELSALSDGSFDITIGPVVSLWGIGTDHARVPGTVELKKALSLVNYKDVVLNDKARSVYLKRKGMSIDLGAIAKGWAADRVYRYLVDNDVEKGIINLGGNVFVIGRKSNKRKWHVGIQNPEKTRGNYLGILSVSDEAVVTSGKYERFFVYKGKKYHHIFNTFTGYPIENDLISVTIIGRDSITADGYSTVVFSLGLKRGMKLVEETPFIEAVIITGEQNVYLSSGAKKIFSLSNPDYRVVQ